MLIEEQPNQEKHSNTSNSGKKDYIVFAIGFVLVLLSNFSDLNKNIETNGKSIQEATATIPGNHTSLVKIERLLPKEDF